MPDLIHVGDATRLVSVSSFAAQFAITERQALRFLKRFRTTLIHTGSEIMFKADALERVLWAALEPGETDIVMPGSPRWNQLRQQKHLGRLPPAPALDFWDRLKDDHLLVSLLMDLSALRYSGASAADLKKRLRVLANEVLKVSRPRPRMPRSPQGDDSSKGGG